MRTILLIRGAPGCGKSTFIDKYGLRIFALSADELRMQCQSPQQTVDGKVEIGFANEKLVWDTLFKILEIRMQSGEFTVIDATNSKAEEMNRYKKLADEYRYRIYLLDLTSLPIEECKRRNAGRDSLKQVPENAIDKMYARFVTQHVPSGIKIIQPKDVFNPTIEDLKEIWLKPIDLSSFRKIIHIGDIHGCNTVLQEYLNNGLEDDVYFIFIGDYIDRGIENADVIKFLLSIKDKRNVLLLTGNHEINSLSRYAHGKKAYSREFELVTKQQLAEFDKKDLRQLCRKFVQCAWYRFHEKEVFVCHGGISTMLDNLTFLATNQMVKGVGGYDDYEAVADTWMRTTSDNQYQIFGHRNTKVSPVQLRDRVFNLEGNVEFGGCLRAVELDHNGFHTVEIRNTVFKPKEDFDLQSNINSTDIAKLVMDMRNSNYIQEKNFGDISSFNFTRTAFQRKIWNGLTTHARGLFIDTSKMTVCCRSYEKFFGDWEIDFAELKDKLHFPLTVYVKENGFLGLISYDESADDFRFCTKSVIGGEFADWFRDIFYSITTEKKRSSILDYLKENNVTYIFEVIDIEHDPHIIEYRESKIVLLDIVKNQLEFEALPYNKLWEVAHDMGLECKRKILTLDKWETFCAWYDDVRKLGYQLDNEYIEGYVIHDAENFMFKVKTEYYTYWKRLRPIIAEVWHKGYIEGTGRLTDETQNRFYGFLQKLWRETEDKTALPNDIVSLRRMLYERN